MAIINGYASLTDLKSHLSLGDGDDNTELELAIEAASRAIDDYCGRFFYQQTATVRHFAPTDASTLVLDVDLVSVTTLETDAGSDGTYEHTWTADTDFLLEPYNAADDGRPYWKIVRNPTGSYSFPTSGSRPVRITGTWGWPAVPAPVKHACIVQAAKLFQIAKDGGGGYSDFSIQGGAQSRYLERSVELLVAPYRLVRVG